jgi:hypothetical protein
MQKYNSVGISIPTDILLIIDKERGDISRSRYILRILQKTFPTNNVSYSKGSKNMCRRHSLYE